VELFERIRRDSRLEGLSIRGLARRHGVHRRMVREALASAVPAERKTPQRTATALCPAHRATVRGWLVGDRTAPPKQRHTARRVWQRLLAEQGAVVAESTVRAFVAEVRRELGGGTGLVMVPQTHPPAEEALCGIPHKASYEEPGNMRRRPRTVAAGPVPAPMVS